MDNIIYMFDIPLFTYDGYADAMEDGTQYQALEWKLIDMEKYNGKYIVVGFDGSLRIYPMRRKTPCFSYGDIRRVHRIYASN